MARTFIRQTQVSGSVAISYLNEAGRTTLDAAPGHLQDDLDSIRSVIQDISGEAEYYLAPSEKSLKNLGEELKYIMTSSAHFLGHVEIDGEAQFDNSVIMGAGISVTGTGSFTSDIEAVNATFSGDMGAVNATLSGDLGAVNATLSGDLGAVNATLSGDLGAVNATLSGDLGAVNATLSGDLGAVNATLSGDLGAVNGNFSGDLVVSGDLTVSGTTTYIDTDNLLVKDAVIVIGSGSTSEATAGGVLGFKAGNDSSPWASILFDNSQWNLSHALNVTGNVTGSGDLVIVNINASGDINAVNGVLSGDLDAVNAVLTGDIDAVNAVFSGDMDAVNATLTGDLAAVDAILSGDLSAVSGSFTGDLIADNITISQSSVASAAELNIEDQRFSIQLSDSDEAALASPRYDSVISIVGALNKINDDLDAIGQGHQKEIHPITELKSEVTASFTLPSDIQDDLNVYVNGILVHASGSFASKAAVGAQGIDAAKSSTANSIIFAFDLKEGDVVTFEKF